MAETGSLAERIEKQLPAELIEFMRTAGDIAAKQGFRLYLVGGVVRDLLLGRTNLDLDLVVEGDALALAERLASLTRGKLVKHPRFNTAKLRWNGWSADLATARSETYERPGALPKVKPGSIDMDLFRRDFTINAMAIELVPGRYGELIDPYKGRHDLEHGLVRILHEKSFIDDATRIWRALRYEQRLDFRLEAKTRRQLRRDVAMLETISGDRIRHELELALKEAVPERILRRAKQLGVLTRLHPSLKGDGWLAEKFEQARLLSAPDRPSVELYLALLAYRLSEEEKESLISYLRLPRASAQALRDSNRLKAELDRLADPGLAPSAVYSLLHGYATAAILASRLAGESPVARRHIKAFLTRLRYVRPALTGNDLIKMGIPPGPRLKEILQKLHEARLDGKVTNKKGEVELVRRWIAKGIYR